MPLEAPPGILVKDLSSSELAYRLLGHARRQPCVFFQEQAVLPVIEPNGPVVSTAEAWGYKGPLIATTLSTASKLASFPGRRLKAFYLWDLEWLRLGAFPYAALASVYRNDRLVLVCRHRDHKAAVEDAWNRTVAGVVTDANPAEILELALNGAQPRG